MLADQVGAANSRDSCSFQERADFAGSTQARQVTGKAVGEIYHGADQALLHEPLAQPKPGLGVEVLFHYRAVCARVTLAALEDLKT